jgi:ABC-type lipoprotein release transport system permease subunit
VSGVAKRLAPAYDTRADEDLRPSSAPVVVWHGGFAGPFAAVWLAAQRLGRSWRLLLAVELGMLIAVALLATAPFYGDLVASAQLQNTLATSPSYDRNIQIDATIPSLANANLPQFVDQAVKSDVARTVGSIVSGPTEYLQTTRLLTLTKLNGKPIGEALPQYPVSKGAEDLPMAFDYAQILPYMKLYAGRLPRDTAASAEPEVMVTPAMGVKPGARLTFVDSQVPSFTYTVRVVGVWFPKNERDPFWNGLGFDTVVSSLLNNPPPPEFPILFTRASLTHIFIYPPTQENQPMGLGLHYIYYVASNNITFAHAQSIIAGLKTLRNALDTDVVGSATGVSTVGMATSLGSLLGSVTSLLANQTLPLYSVDAQLVALALLFIFVMAGLLIESQAGEIATLKSRGASTLQILLIYMTQGILLASVALVAGVAVAGGLALALVRFFVPLAGTVRDTLTPAYVARAVSPRDALIPAVIGAALGLVALVIATWRAARMDALAFRREQGRSERAPFWKRYFLDIGLAVLCVAGYVELATFGSLGARAQINSLTGQSAGAGQADYVQIIAPTLMLLAGALLVQRALPWVVRLGASLAGRLRGATAMLAFSQVTRASAVFSRLTLLLTLAVGMGLFALSFQTTLAQGAHDNAYYLTGADERVMIMPQTEGTQSTLGYAAAFAKLPGVTSVAPMYRGVALTLPNQGGQNVDVLAVDPAALARTATWRADYADQSLASLMASLQNAKHGANAGVSGLPIVALIDQTYANTFQLAVGQRFQVSPQESDQANTSSSVHFIVGGIVQDFPTLYDEYATGYIIVDLNDYLAALQNPSLADYTENGPNEFLLRTNADPVAAQQRARALTDPNFFVQSTLDAQTLTTRYRNDPLQAGMSGLLLLGALIASLLALVGVLTQAGVATRRRQTQFAILRTLGLSEGRLTTMLVLEQALVYLLGAAGGVAIGALLAYGSLPFLGFNTATYAPPVIGVPASQLSVNFTASLVYLAGLLAIFAVALLVAALVARAAGLGRALRVGED